MKKNVLAIVFALVFLNTTPSKAESDDIYQDPELRAYLSQSVSNLEGLARHIKEQYVSVTSRLAKLEYDIPEKFQYLSNLFQSSNSGFRFDNNANLFYDAYDTDEFEQYMIFAMGDRAVPEPSAFATLEQLLAVSNQVVALSASLSSLSASLTSIQSTISSISASQSSLQNSLQNLTTSYNQLNELCNNLSSAVKVNSDGSVVIAKSSPIVGNIEPTTGASYWQPAVDGGWNRAGNTFRVSHDSQLESVTLYCDNVARIISAQNVYIAACEVNGGIPQIIEYPADSINTSNFPRITYSFSSPVPISADRDYLLCVKTLGNAPLYVYTCPNIRYGEFYKPYGASDGPRGGGNDSDSDDDYVPRSGLTPQQCFYEYLSACWSLTYTTQDIWSIFKFSDDESFTFTEGGLSVEKGNISVAGSEVLTAANVENIIETTPSILNSKITWSSLTQVLRDKLITTDGTNVIENLTVTNLYLPNNGNWLIGSPTNRTDIVIRHEDGCITTHCGDLNLAANGNGRIRALNFLEFENIHQCGKTRIIAGSNAVNIAEGLTENAVINVTPAQRIDCPYWVEIDEFGTAIIKLSNLAQDDLYFYFTILKQ